MNNELLNMLEKVLSITESFNNQMDAKDYDTWSYISARCADIRETKNMSEASLSNLIKAFQILLKYGDVDYPTCCEHDTLHVHVDSKLVSEEDKKELKELGFFVGEEYPDHFISFRYGSS